MLFTLHNTQVCTLLSDINEVLDNESMGGGSIKGHSQALVMHMLKELQSFQAFSRILTDQYNLLCDGIHCLEEYHQKLTVSYRQTYVYHTWFYYVYRYNFIFLFFHWWFVSHIVSIWLDTCRLITSLVFSKQML